MAEQKGLPHVKSKADTLAQLEKQRQELTAQIAAGRADALAEIVGAAISQAAQIGIDVDELAQAFRKGGKHQGKSKAAGSRAPAPAKYRNPKNAAEVWSGRGRKPLWVEKAIKGGATLESLAIAPASPAPAA